MTLNTLVTMIVVSCLNVAIGMASNSRVLVGNDGAMSGESRAPQGSAEAGEEKSIFVLSRHGARNTNAYDYRPYLSPELLAKLSAGSEAARIFTLAPDEQKDALTKVFGVPPSGLTVNGQACEEKAGEAIADLLGKGTAYAYADTDQRDIRSATAFSIGATRKGVSATQPFSTGGADKPDSSEKYMIAEGSDPKLRTGCARANLAETLSATGYADLEALDRAAPKEQTKYLEAHGFKFPTPLKSAEDEHGQLGFYANVDGPLRTTCRIAQHFVCERAANVSDPTFKAVGVKENELVWLYEACDFVFALYRNRVNTLRFGTEFNVALAAAMDAAYKGEVSKMPLVKHSPSTALVLYEAHDCNVDFLRQTLGLEWDVPQIAPKNAIPFSTKIVLVLNRKTGSVEAYVYAVPLDAMADGCRTLNASHAFTKLAIPSCVDHSKCPYEKVRTALLRDAEKSTCLPEDIRTWHSGVEFVKSETASSGITVAAYLRWMKAINAAD